MLLLSVIALKLIGSLLLSTICNDSVEIVNVAPLLYVILHLLHINASATLSSIHG